MCRIAEQRAASCWRILSPDFFYKSIDHATTFLNLFDKKFT